ncbi:MAG: hypothetical protein PF444_00425, partial [Bacteroidales bacterium]|nr:hypothetical protein [Bacteroidales bacterium]
YTYEGLMFVKKTGNKYTFIYNLKIWGTTKLLYDKHNLCIWVYTSSTGLLQFKLTEEKQLDGKYINDISQMFNTKYGIIFYNGERLLQYKKDKLVPLDQGIFQAVKGPNIRSLDISKDGNQIAFIQENKISLVVSLPDGNLHSYDKVLSALGDDLLKEDSFLELENNELRIATNRGVTVFNLSHKSNFPTKNRPVISSVRIKGDKEVTRHFFFPYENNKISLSSGKKDVEFRFGIHTVQYEIDE